MVDSFERTVSQKRAKQLLRNPSGIQQSVNCARIRLAASRVPRRQPHSIRGPGGRPRFAFKAPLVGPRRRRPPAASRILWSARAY